MATSIDAVSSDKMEALLQCSICLEALNNPRTLPCFHSYCKCCLERLVNNIRKKKPVAALQCPLCRSEFTLGQGGVEGMTSNHFICNMLEVMAVQDRVKGTCIPCSHCQKPSVGRCVTCEVFMCEKCFQTHNSYLGFRDHCVLTMEELSKHENRSKITGSSYCKEHESKKLKFFCETCEQLICRYCMDFDHLRHNHECLPLDKVVAQKTDALKVCCETLDRNLNESNEALQHLRNVAIYLQDNAKQAKDDVRQQQKDILTAVERMLDKQVETVINDIDTTFNNKHGDIVVHIKEVEIYVNKVKSFVDVSNSLLENGNGEEIVSSQKMINDNSEMLKTERLKHIGQIKHDDTISYTRQPIDDLQIEELLEKVGTVHDAIHPNDDFRPAPPKEEALEKTKEEKNKGKRKKRKESENQSWFGSKTPERNQSGPRDEDRSPNSDLKEKPSDQCKTDVTQQITQPASPSYPPSQSQPCPNQAQGISSQNQPHPNQAQAISSQRQPRPNQGQVPSSYIQPRSNQGQVPSSYIQPRSNQGQVPSSYIQPRSNQGQVPSSYSQPRPSQGQGIFSDIQPRSNQGKGIFSNIQPRSNQGQEFEDKGEVRWASEESCTDEESCTVEEDEESGEFEESHTNANCQDKLEFDPTTGKLKLSKVNRVNPDNIVNTNMVCWFFHKTFREYNIGSFAAESKL